MSHFCARVHQFDCVHAFEIFFQKPRNHEMMNGKSFFLVLFCTSSYVGENKTNPQKFRRHKFKVEILLDFIICCLESIGFYWGKK